MVILFTLVGNGLKPVKKAKKLFNVPVGTVTFSNPNAKTATFKFNNKAVDALKLTPETISGKEYEKVIALFETDDNSVVAFNSTPFGDDVPKKKISKKSYSVKLSSEEVNFIYKVNGLTIGEDYIFALNVHRVPFQGKTIDTFTIEKLQKLEVVKRAPRARSPQQLAQDARMKSWFASEKLAGRTPTVPRYWSENKA